jgi:hypothetical protein
MTFCVKAGLLALGSSVVRTFPPDFSGSGFLRIRPRLQRRDRSRITRDSLLSLFKAPLFFYKVSVMIFSVKLSDSDFLQCHLKINFLRTHHV